ncbi:MAG: GDP-mannose 4,6-dehydratase [Candidatus Omnitrophica bacterium]|nr:GDP-mannose 4,6-dehydratase [Candidatus Omnitrophota bacterium]
MGKEKLEKILVSGAAGFVGSHLCDKLLERGHAVIGVDDLSSGSRDNLETCLAHANFEFVEGDVCDAGLVEKAVGECDAIAHLAAKKIPRYSDGLDTLTVNVKGTEMLLKSAAAKGCRFLFASTSDVYGMNPDLPFSEESLCVLGPSYVTRWSYAVSKLFDEHLVFAYADRYKMPFSIVRYFGGYGPRQHSSWTGGPQAVFIDAAARNEPIEIHGDGLQTRSFMYIDDLVEATYRALTHGAAVGRVINIGSPEEISILDLAKLIWGLVAGAEKPQFKFVPYKNLSRGYQDVRRRVPDLTELKTLLDFESKYDLREGLSKTVEWRLKALAQEVS